MCGLQVWEGLREANLISLRKNIPTNNEYEKKQRNMLKFWHNFIIDGLSII